MGLDGNIYEKQGYVIKCPNLRKLSIRDLYVNRGPLYFDLLLKPLHGKEMILPEGSNQDVEG